MGSLALAFLELTFVMVSIMLTHSMKRTIGNASFYLMLGVFFVFGQIVTSARLLIDPGIVGFQVNMGNTMLLAPFMVAILIVYIIDGTLEAQQMILGLLAVLFGYFYLANITASQCRWLSRRAANPGFTLYVGSLFMHGRRVVFASFVAHAVDLFILPIVFQSFHNRRSRLFFSVLGTLVCVQVIDSFIYELIVSPQAGGWWIRLRSVYLARALVMVWLSILTTVYLHMWNVQRAGARRPFDIILAFVEGYRKSLELQRHLREWEGRYRIVVQNSHDFIFILNSEGGVLNANRSAISGFGERIREEGFSLPGLMEDTDGVKCDWQAIWLDLFSGEEQEDTPPRIVRDEWHSKTRDGETMYLDVSLSRADLDEQPVALLVARDMTDRRRLENERKSLHEQLVQSQKMEAIGLLAGGVAHDFNNLLHTIQGSIDGLSKKVPEDAEQADMLSNISTAKTRASELVTQLLGFARKGKFVSKRLDITAVMKKAGALFEPVAHKNISFKMISAPVPMIVRGDGNQLQQVLLNLLLNARDAVQDRGDEGKISLRVEPASEHIPGRHLKSDANTDTNRYVCVRVKDNGTGIPQEIEENIFDPFFTTKEVGKGTGMGLAMVYGCIANHGGWVHFESEIRKGTEFFIFLPRI